MNPPDTISLCFACRKKFSRFKGYGCYCQTCYRLVTLRGSREFIEIEAAKRDEKLNVPVDLHGPAVTNLLQTPIFRDPLPKYSERAEFISSIHCRLCLTDCAALEPLQSYSVPNVVRARPPDVSPCGSIMDAGGSGSPAHDEGTAEAVSVRMDRYNWGIDFRVARHALECHGYNPEQYCREVYGRILAEGLQPITPQVVRSCLHDWKAAQTDRKFHRGVCACCAREKLLCKLKDAVFPPRAAHDAPQWMEWSAEAWSQHGATWYESVNVLLDVESYLRKYFHADERVQDAELALLHDDDEKDACAVQMKEVFRDRAIAFRCNMRGLLREDGVPAPSDGSVRWMLYGQRDSSLRIVDGTSAITCVLCKRCSAALAKTNAKGQPVPELALQARARGLWIAQEPEAIRVLSWAERLVLRLGRTYAAVKRVSTYVAPWAAGNIDATPQYTTRNVVCYPQDPDTAIRAMCLLPDDLAKVLFIQFEGSDRKLGC